MSNLACLGLSFHRLFWVDKIKISGQGNTVHGFSSGNKHVSGAGFCNVFGKQVCGSQHKYLFVMVVDQRDFTAPAHFQQFLWKS